MSNTTIVPILEGTNFNNWQYRIAVLLRKDQCIEALQDPPSAAATPEDTARYKRADVKAQAIIVQSGVRCG